MIYEHEIPEGSKLYFGKSAALKRKIETLASDQLVGAGFEEIITPFFSYHQHHQISEKELLRFSDHDNHLVSLRSDSTLDVVRIVTRRLGRSTSHKRWFYVQPVFRYPSFEFYQIGGELIGEDDLSTSVTLMGDLLETLTCKPYLQVSNIAIPRAISTMFSIPLDVLRSGHLETLLQHKEPWLNALATLQRPEDIDKVIALVPEVLKAPLEEMKRLVHVCGRHPVVLAPLYYAKMQYYDQLFFRFVYNNKTLGSGGCYQFEAQTSSGFGVHTDAIIETLMR
ncbi:MAG: ATP phosphoribosyltransferase regulatory subunit [Campylobacterales bacterium]|nr:ATP phosphoribosyltransferase regulatory subunit [Campylobacterales bacterium]